MDGKRPIAYVVHQPMRKDSFSGAWKPSVDLSPAAEFGDLVFMLDTPERPALDPEVSLPILRQCLKNFRACDYLVLAGDFHLVAYAAAIAARVTGGPLNVLRWQPNTGRYIALAASIFDPPARAVQQAVTA